MTDPQLPARDGGFLNVSSHRIAEWENQYPGVDIKEELAKARAWLERNPGKRWKTLAGFTNWLKTAAASTTYRKEQDHISDPRQSRHVATRYVHTEFEPTGRTPDHQRQAHLAFLNRLTKGRYGREHGDLSETELAAVAGAPMPQSDDVREHRRCWGEFRRLLEG